MGHLAIMVGGPYERIPAIKNRQSKELIWIGVDRGALRLLEHGIVPKIALGDFDSVTKEELKTIKNEVADVRVYKAEKDETDTELAVRIAFDEFKPDSVSIYGATGGRMDHFLNNIFMVFQPKLLDHAAKIRLIDVQNTIMYFLPGSHTLSKEQDKKYLAFTCLSPVEKLTIQDAKYRLADADFTHPISLASNEFISDTVNFSFISGMIAVIQSKD
ncbi:thiamine diphosphokinase [Carnobacterium viridans]|uniref:Thiamine diphosphokinase n=1 Tax=Carnobacterium viridans TaxID=174587 RepID=A0A1H0XSX7_9LACT|nr:thiamine diphosphokinase [Carnobacterium viridans]UDE95557.1 thiamine diphosphokinase [Carnobacterium viridans]SDQ06012.1 thiamine diphosphokinase [Carnobacterium viridans]